MKLAVCLTSCNRMDLTQRAIARQREIDPKIVVVVADAAKEPTPDCGADEYIHTPGTVHAVTAHHALMLGIMSGATYLVTSNDDALPPKNYRDIMLPEWESLVMDGKNPGMLGASTERCKGPQNRREGPMEQIPFVVPIFAWTTPKAYLAAPFDASNPVCWFSDDQITLDMKRAGMTLWMSSCFVEHEGSQSLAASGKSLNFEDFHGSRWMAKKYGQKWREELSRL